MRAQKTPFDIRYRVIPCSAAQVLTFHSQRMEFIPAVPGCVIALVFGLGFKDAGPVFVLGAAGFIQARYNNTAKLPALSLPVAGFLDITTSSGIYSAHPATNTAFGNEANAADAAGKSIVSGTNGNADYTGIGGPITLVLAYRIIPVNGFKIAQLTDTGRPR